MSDEQILAQATLEKNPIPPSASGLSAEQQKAAAIRTEMSKNGGGLAAFDAAISASQRIDAGSRAKTLDANFGIDRDPTSGAKKRDATTEPGSQARYDRAQTALQQAEEILTTGLSTDRDKMLGDLENAIALLPGYSDFLSTISDPHERKAMVEGLLREPKLREKIRANYEKTTAESARLKDEVTEAKKKADEAEAARVKKQAERDAVTAKGGTLDLARTDELSFADITTPGALGTELDALQKDATGAPRDLEAEERDALNVRNRARTLFDARNKRFADLQVAGKVPGDADYDDAERLLNVAQGDLSNAENNYSQAKKDKARRVELEKQKAELPGKIKQLEADEVRLISEYSDAEKAALLAKADLNSKQVDRAASEEAYASNAERIVSDAMREYLRDQMHAADVANKALIDKKEAEAKSVQEKTLIRQIKERYLVPKGKDVAINVQAARGDIARAFDTSPTGGAENILRDALRATHPDVPNPTPPPARIEDPEVVKMMSNPDFVNKYTAEIMKQAFITHMRNGGKISEGQQAFIEAQPWGEALIGDLINSPAVKQKEKEMVSKGMLPPGGFREYMESGKKGKREITKLGLLFALTIGMIPVIGTMASLKVPLNYQTS